MVRTACIHVRRRSDPQYMSLSGQTVYRRLVRPDGTLAAIHMTHGRMWVRTLESS